jgi:cytoskeletal protein CcmA (bactofilin family)
MRFNVGHDRHAGGARDRPGAGAEVNNPPKPRTRSVLDCSVRLTGDLWSEGDVQLDGHLCGNISCGQLIVGKDAAVTGVIIAQEAVIRGKITGIIRATRVLLQETARVESEIIYRTLAVDEGATFEGIARPRPNPLAEDFTVPPMPEARGRMGEPEAAANGAGAERAMAGQGGALAPADTRRQLEGPSAARG